MMKDETDGWEQEALMLTATHGLVRMVEGPVTAADLLEEHPDKPGLCAHIEGVAKWGGEGVSFADGWTYRVRRATRAEALGQEDRLHEDDEEETCRLDQGECCPPERCSCGLAHMGEHGEDHDARQAEKDAHDDASGRFSSDAYDEEVLRERLDEALTLLAEVLPYAESRAEDMANEADDIRQDENEDQGAKREAAELAEKASDAVDRATAFLAKAGRG